MARRKFKMRGGGLPATSEGGMNTLLLIVLIAVLAFIAYQIYKMNTAPVQVAGITGGLGLPNVLIGSTGGGGMASIAGGLLGGSMPPTDDRYSQAPKPMRMWRAPPDTSVWNPTTLPSISTQGLPESFQTIGLLQYPGGDLKPLLGRRTAGSNDRWNYYTRTDTYNPVPLPLSQGRRDCMDDTGCNEVFDGDNLKSMGGEQVKVKLYKMNGPTYIPL